MDNYFGPNDTVIRLGVFAGVLLVMALLELILPKRKLIVPKGRRWFTNLGISVTAALVLRAMAALAVPVAAIAAAFYAQANGIGLLNNVAWPDWVKIVIALAALDLAIWAQHLASHKIPILWRLHQVHHADRDIDVTTAVRFHPIEIALSMLWKIVVVVPLGASPLAVFLFEVILNGCAMFNHANIDLPPWLDRTLRLFVVTPDMHRVHHSVEDDETNSNFGFNLSWWDRLFGTYRDQPRGGHEGMTIGIRGFRNPRDVSWLPGLLVLPFRGKVTGYAINRRQWKGEASADE